MPERNLPASDARYRPLKDYVSRKGGLRLALHGGTRDRLVEMAVEEFPRDCRADKLEEVLRARMAIRIRRQYGSVVATFLISVLVNIIARAVIDWWFSRMSHRVLMEGWVAQARPDV